MANFYDQFRVQRNERGTSFINLGEWHGYDAVLDNMPGSNTTALQVGCRYFVSAADARLHWRGGVSRDGAAPRPFAEALIALAEALCRINGWQNWAGPLLPASDHARPLLPQPPSNHASLHNIIAERDRTIQDLRRDLNHERECVGSRDQMIQRNAVAINRLNQTISERDRRITELEMVIRTKDGVIERSKDQTPEAPVVAHAMGLPQMNEVREPTIYSPEQQVLQRQLNELHIRVAELERKATSNG